MEDLPKKVTSKVEIVVGHGAIKERVPDRARPALT
jgi:hypothetical protein